MARRDWYNWIDMACDVLLDNCAGGDLGAGGCEATPEDISALEEMRSCLRTLSAAQRLALGDALDCAIDAGALEGALDTIRPVQKVR